MVYKKTRRYRRGRKAKGVTVKKLNSKLNRMMSTLKPELKISDSSVDNFALQHANAGSGNYLRMLIPDPALVGGTSYLNQRVGQQIRLRSIQFKAYVRVASGNPITSTIRFMLVRFPKTSALPISGVIENVTQEQGVNSPLQSQYRSQFQILYDRRVTLNPFGYESQNLSFFKKGNFPMNFVGNGTTPVDGELTLFAFSDVAGSGAPILNLYVRTRYTDV